MPNVSTCDTDFIRDTISKSDKAIAIAWSKSAEMNELVEKVSELESSGIPVFVLDCDSCGKVSDDFKVKPGETIIFQKGKEVGRVTPTGSPEDIAKIREIAARP
jgi:hypothetical protein